MADTVFRTRSLGAPAVGVEDQYADGKAAKLWKLCVGDVQKRTEKYSNFLINFLRSRGCKRILDAACGTGIDSVLLLEEGFEVVSTDASDKMLKYALKTRWSRRREPAFDQWIIEEANWLTLYDDIQDYIGSGFDAVLCLGSSFPHLLDSHGDQREQSAVFRFVISSACSRTNTGESSAYKHHYYEEKRAEDRPLRMALQQFERCVKPGGFLIIDHRNYDNILDTGRVQVQSMYYNGTRMTDIKTYVICESGKPSLIVMDYSVDVSELKDDKELTREPVSGFRMSYYPHRLEAFGKMLKEAFGRDCRHHLYGDFRPLEEVTNPMYYIHIVEKPIQVHY